MQTLQHARASFGRVRRGVGRLWRDARATVAIEFAFALPLMLMMTLALYEVTEGVICYMKVVDVANTVADLVSLAPATGIGNTEFDNYYIAGQMVIYPSTGSNLGFAVASVYFNSTGASPTVAWQIQRGGAAAITNATSFVNGLGSDYGSTVIVQASYTYTSVLDYFLTSPIVITSEVAESPRYALYPSNPDGIPCPPTSGSETCD
jgi:Flp pilus assembly protein TadG